MSNLYYRRHGTKAHCMFDREERQHAAQSELCFFMLIILVIVFSICSLAVPWWKSSGNYIDNDMTNRTHLTTVCHAAASLSWFDVWTTMNCLNSNTSYWGATFGDFGVDHQLYSTACKNTPPYFLKDTPLDRPKNLCNSLTVTIPTFSLQLATLLLCPLYHFLKRWPYRIVMIVFHILVQCAAVVLWGVLGKKVWGFDLLATVDHETSGGRMRSSPTGWILAVVNCVLLFVALSAAIRSNYIINKRHLEEYEELLNE
ncbi:hypothetical protein PROFUN_14165 [Planoprotostelium fungivorum]|uniref:Uncharacterized protein n=1 Tax=Planoprotostelium fungivorum TaxID=1890364 RepID=A0A2P6N1C0_9EUKA|nr:hypothetical protein PROFUN_14165 [Planoprotostelium fungivorum]